MSKNSRYYQMSVSGKEANIDIYGDITSWPWVESDTSSYMLSRALDEIGDVDVINVNINSYGGEVAEGIAIYNALKRHKAKVVTRCDGMACSIASVIFMAGDERVMYDTSMLMIHNAMVYAGYSNAAELRKAADDAEKITGQSIAAYMACVSIGEDELKSLMDAETFLSPSEALEMGFATGIDTPSTADVPAQSARASVFGRIFAIAEGKPEDDPGDQEEPDDDPEPDDTEPDDPEEMEADPEDEEDEAKQAVEQSLAAFLMSINNF